MLYYITRSTKNMIWESNILLKYLVGKCTKQESKEVNEWLLESDYNKKTLSHLRMTEMIVSCLLSLNHIKRFGN